MDDLETESEKESQQNGNESINLPVNNQKNSTVTW